MNVYQFGKRPRFENESLSFDHGLTWLVDLLQFGGGGHVGERVERLGNHHHLPPQQQTADCGGPFYQADGQRIWLHDLHFRCGVNVQPAGHCCG